MNAVMALNGQGQELGSGQGSGQGRGYYSNVNRYDQDDNTDPPFVAVLGRPSPITSPSTASPLMASPPIATHIKTTSPTMSSPPRATNVASSLSFASPDDRPSKSLLTRHTQSAASSTYESPASPNITSTSYGNADSNNRSPSARTPITDSLSSWRELCHTLEKERDELRASQVGEPLWSMDMTLYMKLIDLIP